MTDKTYKYSEIFHSFQGEGHYTGIPCAWIRFFLCNLQCNGFGQEDPTDPSTYKKPFETIDLTDITDITDLPVFEYGCDSSYTWAKRYMHLASEGTASEICDTIAKECLINEWNSEGTFKHPSGQDTHMCFTGGEPMLNQDAMVDIIREFNHRGNIPNYVTVETNGTRKMSDELFDMIQKHYAPASDAPEGEVWDNREWFWSVSPKLFSTSGEKHKRAIKPEHLARYAEASNHGQLKYVVNGTPESWKEVEENTKLFRDAGIDWDVWIMAVGATKEEQEEEQIAKIAVEAIQRGYKFSGRLHCHIFGNKIGT